MLPGAPISRCVAGLQAPKPDWLSSVWEQGTALQGFCGNHYPRPPQPLPGPQEMKGTAENER